MDDWYCEIADQTCGPMSFDDLVFLAERGQLTAHARVRQGTQGEWRIAEQLPRLPFKPAKPKAAAPVIRPVQPPVEANPPVPPAEPVPTAPAVVAAPPAPAVPPPRSIRSPHLSDERRKRALLGAAIGAAVALLILLILLMLVWPQDGQPGLAGGNQSEGSGLGNSSGDGQGDAPPDASSGAAEGAGDASVTTEEADTAAAGGPVAGRSAADGEETSPPEPPPPVDAFSIASLPTEASSEQGNTGTSQGASGLLGKGGGGGSGVSEFFGVKVRGKLALVCDISGSMAQDFPILVKELRKRYPRETPIILVNGCDFNVPYPGTPPPQKLVANGMTMPYVGPELANDPHAYTAQGTTQAILFAVEELKRDTVMFNNDLQDGGSESSITAFEELRRRRRFTLSGRSLNCDAPDCLKRFIKASGGDFKVDPISRAVQPAQFWGP